MDQYFDWKTYVNNYKDLRNSDINTREKAWNHWVIYGKLEGRTYENLNNFYWENYVNNYEDLQKAEINTREKALKHWVMYGKLEGRTYENLNNFDWEIYVNNYEDLQNTEINTREKALKHWVMYGKSEGRTFMKINKNNIINNSIIIYILCYNEKILNDAYKIYNKYKWAKPILMKYQDYSFENIFWKQLSEIEEEWKNCVMVGTLSYSAYKKINLDTINNIINKKLYLPYSYYNFMDSNISIINNNTKKHPLFEKIWNDVIVNLNLITTTENCCNYWMCKPKIMKQFINWYINIALPILITTEDIFSDSKYIEGKLTKDELLKLSGQPYYSYFPFIVERLNKCFFITNYKIVFLISHEKTHTGAVNALLNVQKFYEKNNIKTILLYLEDIINIDIVSYVYKTSQKINCSPVIICNTLATYNIVNKLANTNIITYWYIHEWYTPDNYFSFINNYIYLFNIKNINIIFTCNSCSEQYKKYILNINNKIIINNGYSQLLLENKLFEVPKINIIKNKDDIFISIIGTIEERKNQQKFIDNIFYKCKDKYLNIKLLLVGEEKEKLNINPIYQDSIIMTNLVDNALPYIKLSDIIVVYSVNEVLPLNIIESFYCCKPVLSSNVGGISEMIVNEENGYLFEVNDYISCFKNLCNLIENEELRINIGKKGNITFFEKYEENVAFNEFLLLLSYFNKVS
jgi:glycosyltransferase involved in cell wall biosynthesis